MQSAIHELAKHTKHKLPELVLRPINNSSNNLEDDMRKNCNKNSKNSTETNLGSENTSLIERAIVYYNKELKGDKLS